MGMHEAQLVTASSTICKKEIIEDVDIIEDVKNYVSNYHRLGIAVVLELFWR
jgi:hypothetical protein